MKTHDVEVPHVLIVRAGDAAERLETWHVRITATTADDRPVTPYNRPEGYTVCAERVPDAVCHEEVTTTARDVGRSLGVAREHARQLARVLACGSGIECPGIVACIDGAPCPYGIAPKKIDTAIEKFIATALEDRKHRDLCDTVHAARIENRTVDRK